MLHEFLLSSQKCYLRTKVTEVFTIFDQDKIFMQVFSKIKRFAPIVAIIALSFLASCAAKGGGKYGCPNHLRASSFSN
jgi:hypothetical protein